MNSRTDPDDATQKIVVCGAGTWGDTPDGLGYETMSSLFALEIASDLGIR